MIAWPGVAPTTSDVLTTSTDIHATVADIFNAEIKHVSHGSSLAPVIHGDATSVRDWLLTGVWGREVQLVTEQWRYTKGPSGANTPHSMWSNRWSTMPIASMPDYKMPMPDARATLDFMPGSSIPVIRQPFRDGDMLPFWAYAETVRDVVVLIDKKIPMKKRIASAMQSRAMQKSYYAALYKK